MDLDEARDRIVAERHRVEALASDLRDVLAGGEREDVSELADYDQHPAERATETFEREKDLSILGQLESELAELQAALERIDAGTYGIDEETGEPIDPARLDAIPSARRNVEPPDRRA